MSTRCRIGIKEGEKITSIYCHFDGYPSYTGLILYKHYNTQEKVKKLIDLGDISILKETPESTVAYARDVKLDDTKAITTNTLEEFEILADPTDYQYLFENGKWNYTRNNINNLMELESICY